MGAKDAGSPPHTRGTQINIITVMSIAGITPAYAGNTIDLGHILYGIEDHPRIRGEH